MNEYVYGGPPDIDRAIGLMVALDNIQSNALAVLQIDDAINELSIEYERTTADSGYRPDADFISRLSGYLAMADDREDPDPPNGRMAISRPSGPAI